MKKLLFSMVALAGLLMASCSNDPVQEPAVKQGKAISLQASMADFTRATDTAFEEGDKIGLYIFTNETYLNNVAYTFAANAFTAATEQVWYEDETLQSQVVAYYPYAASAAADTHTFTVASAQTTHAAYTASDLMVATTTATPTENAINLPFKHMLSKVNLTVVDENNDPVKSVYFVDVAGTVTYEVKNAAQTLAASGEATIEAGKLTDGTYTLVMAPQTVAPTLAITTESGAQYNFKVDNAVEFKAGTVSTASVTIEKQETPTPPDPTPDPDPIVITIDWEIADWAEGEELNFVQSEEEVVVPSGCKIYADVTATGWSNVNIYMWDTTATISADWPGTAISTEEVDGKTYYAYDATALMGKTICVIFNNGTEQTVDMTNIVVENDLYFTLTSKNAEGKWEATILGLPAPDPSVAPVDALLGVVGAHNEWGLTPDNELEWNGAMYVAKGVTLEAGAGFKVRGNNEWNDAFNYGPSAEATIAVNGSVDVVNGSGAQNILAPEAGTFDIYFDYAAMKVYLMAEGEEPATMKVD